MNPDQVITLTRCELDDLCTASARKALADIGLADEKAIEDIKTVRSLLSAWNMAKTSFWKAVWDKLGMMAAGAFLLWIASKISIHGG